MIDQTSETLSPVFTENAVPIVFCSDDNYIKYYAVCLQSLVEVSSPERNYDLIVLTTRVSDDNKRRLGSQVEGRSNFSLRFYDASEINKGKTFPAVPSHEYLTVVAYYRLYIPLILAGYDKAIYLDGDTLIHTDIAKLYDIDIGDNLVGAVVDQGNQFHRDKKTLRFPYEDITEAEYRKHYLGMKFGEYFNSGVLVFNARKMREENTFNDFLKFMDRGVVAIGDQCVLNACCAGRTFYLPPTWNAQPPVHGRKCILDKETAALVLHSPDICHFYYRKPAAFLISAHPAWRWWDVARRSPFSQEIDALLLDHVVQHTGIVDDRFDRLDEKIHKLETTLRKMRDERPLRFLFNYLIKKPIRFISGSFSSGNKRRAVER